MWKSTPPGVKTLSGLERTTEFLRKVSSTTDLSMSDEDLWNSVLIINDSLTRYAAKDVVVHFRPCVVALLENNQSTGNYQKMLTLLTENLKGASSVTSFGLSNYVYIQRICIGMILQEEGAERLLEVKQGVHGSGKSLLVDQVTDAILQAMLSLVDHSANSTCHSLLLLELMKFIIVVCTSGNEGISEVFLESFMNSERMHLCARALLNFWILQHGYGVPKSNIFDDIESESHYAIAAMAKSVLSLPWQAASMLQASSPPKEAPLVLDNDPFATASSLVILIFYFHGSREYSNAFRVSMDALVNDDVLSEEERRAGNVNTSVSFAKLAAAIGKRIVHSESTSLLLYLLLQGNKHVLDYFMARTDIDMIVVPILELLMDIKERKVNHVYILMIILLMLSQDDAFGHNANGLILKEVPFYKTRSLHNIRLDSLIVMVLLQVALYNIHSVQDMYLHTNTLATLANIAPTLSDICPTVCQRILNVLEKLDAKLLSPAKEDQLNRDDSPTLEMQLISDFLNIIVEVLNAVVVNNLTNNPTLVYCMLYKKECLERIGNDPKYKDMASNISITLRFFGDHVEKEISAKHHGLTADRIQDRIILAMRQWNSDMLQASTDLKFSYEEEASNADFFAPYVKSIAYNSTVHLLYLLRN